MIEILQEVTVWDKAHSDIKNGIYHVNGQGQLVGYEPPGGVYKEFSTPMKQFSKSRRKFKKIGQREAELPAGAVQVVGSNGKIYTILDGQCTCPGFKFRGNCKHVNEQ